MYACLRDLYRGDLMPAERKSEIIIRARQHYLGLFVDAMAIAALRVHKLGHHEETLLFANSALMRDSSREDAYALLMKSQVALGQRTAALETYFRCQKSLSDQLGIDPSRSTKRMYRELLEEGSDDIQEDLIACRL